MAAELRPSLSSTTPTTMPVDGKPVLPPIDVEGPFMSPTTTRSPSKLRKSLSVDSFVRLGRPDEPSTASAPGTTAAHSTASPNDRPPSPSRVRTYSVSTADTSSRESSLPRTLSDPTNPPKSYKSRDRPRRTSEEPLPSNVPPTRPRPSPLNDLARTGPLPGPSQYNPLRKSSTSRTRSGSIGMNNPTSGVAMVINTQLTSVCSCTSPPATGGHKLTHSQMPGKSLVTVAVVGCSACGKSSIIKKGCKAYAMSEPTIGMPVTDGKDQFRCGLGRSIDCPHTLTHLPTDTSRFGKINQGPNMTGSLRVLEADLSDFHLDNPSSRVWPGFAPKVDGVIVCYDSSSLASFTHVERLVCTPRLPCSPRNPDEGYQVVTTTWNYRPWLWLASRMPLRKLTHTQPPPCFATIRWA